MEEIVAGNGIFRSHVNALTNRLCVQERVRVVRRVVFAGTVSVHKQVRDVVTSVADTDTRREFVATAIVDTDRKILTAVSATLAEDSGLRRRTTGNAEVRGK